MKNIKAQLEMTFDADAPCRPLNRRQRRLNRAHWWFERMRQAVDRAIDHEPEPAQPETPVFPNVYRQPMAPAPARNCNQQPKDRKDEQQHCE